VTLAEKPSRVSAWTSKPARFAIFFEDLAKRLNALAVSALARATRVSVSARADTTRATPAPKPTPAKTSKPPSASATKASLFFFVSPLFFSLRAESRLFVVAEKGGVADTSRRLANANAETGVRAPSRLFSREGSFPFVCFFACAVFAAVFASSADRFADFNRASSFALRSASALAARRARSASRAPRAARADSSPFRLSLSRALAARAALGGHRRESRRFFRQNFGALLRLSRRPLGSLFRLSRRPLGFPARVALGERARRHLCLLPPTGRFARAQRLERRPARRLALGDARELLFFPSSSFALRVLLPSRRDARVRSRLSFYPSRALAPVGPSSSPAWSASTPSPPGAPSRRLRKR
jgi:hypothetical protein